MSSIARLQRGREVLKQQRRFSVPVLGRETGFGGDELEELVEELVDVQEAASREGVVLPWVVRQTEKGGASPHTGPGPRVLTRRGPREDCTRDGRDGLERRREADRGMTSVGSDAEAQSV